MFVTSSWQKLYRSSPLFFHYKSKWILAICKKSPYIFALSTDCATATSVVIIYNACTIVQFQNITQHHQLYSDCI